MEQTPTTQNLTAEEIIERNLNTAYDYGVILTDKMINFIKKYMQEYAHQVAQQVRQECADKARTKHTHSGKIGIYPVVDKDSILSVDINQFII